MAETFRRVTKILFSPKYLIFTNTAVSGLMLGLGDAIVQNVEIKIALRDRTKLSLMGESDALNADSSLVTENNNYTSVSGTDNYDSGMKLNCEQGIPRQHDWQRTGRMFVMGTIMGPLNHVFYSSLDKYFVGNAGKTVIKKIVLDETCGAPFFAFSFFMGTGILEGDSIKESFKEFRKKFWKVWMADMAVWPAAQFVNFYFLPPRFRVLYVAIVTLGWNTFLSYVKHNGETTVKESHAQAVLKQEK